MACSGGSTTSQPRSVTLSPSAAYNTWGGYRLYQGPDGLPSDRPAGRVHPAQDNVAQVKPPNIPARYDGVD